MFTQPSVNKIVSAYQGNPAPLARKVDQDKKQNGGIPKDLRQLMALNDIATGEQNAGISQALQIPTNMPTVAQNTQQLAQQALQARMMQQSREQQRLQQKPPTVPFGTPQPDMQPQGLDSLRTNVGEGYAEGGIIGFDGKTGSDVKDPTVKEEEATSDVGNFFRSIVKAMSAGREKSQALDTLASKRFAAAPSPIEALTPTQRAEREKQVAKLSEQRDQVRETGEITPVKLATNPATIRSQLNAADVGIRAQPGTPPPPPEPPKANPNAQAQTRVNEDSAPMPAGLQGLASTLATPGLDYQREMLKKDPAKAMADLEAEYNKKVGARDLSIFDKTAAELDARKQKLNAPKPGFEGVMDYLENIAESGGRTWMEAGSKGAALQKQKRLAREAEQNTLMDKILELGAKKSDAMFAEKKGMFDLTQAERDRVIKERSEAAGKLGLSEDKTRELIEQGLQKELDRKNQLKAAAAGNRDNLMSRAQALMAADPTKKMTLDQAMQRAGEIANAGTMEGAGVRNRKAYDDAVKDLNSDLRYMPIRLDKKNDPKLATLRTEYENKIKELQGRYGVTDQGLNALPAAPAAP